MKTLIRLLIGLSLLFTVGQILLRLSEFDWTSYSVKPRRNSIALQITRAASGIDVTKLVGNHKVHGTTEDDDVTKHSNVINREGDAHVKNENGINIDDATEHDGVTEHHDVITNMTAIKRTILDVWRPYEGQDSASLHLSRKALKDFNFVTQECRIILAGSKNEIKKLRNNSQWTASPTSLVWRDLTTDTEVAEIARDCSRLRKLYHFPPPSGDRHYVTKEELEFPLAYSILTHANIHQTVLLLSAIYRMHNIHCIHLDQKASQESLDALQAVSKCFPNVFLSSKRVRVVYATVSRLLADIACMRDLIAIPNTLYDWKYLINLCSQDFPLRTNKEIVEQIKVFKGINSIGGYPAPKEILVRTEFVYKVENITINGQTQEKIVKTDQRHAPPPFNMTTLKNLAYNLFSRQFLEWALEDSEVGRVLLDWSMDTYSPDEHYWLMLHTYPGAPGGSSLKSGYQLSRSIKWSFTHPEGCYGVWRHYICIFGAENIHDLTISRNLFVNKLDIEEDATGVLCLRQWLDERTFSPNRLRQNTNPDKNASIPTESFYI